MSFEKVTLHMHVGGNFVTEPLRYIGGFEFDWVVDPDYICFHTFVDKVVEQQFDEAAEFCYVEPGLDLEAGLRTCNDDHSFIKMIEAANVVKEIHVYVIHGISQPSVVEVVPLLHVLGVTTDDVEDAEPEVLEVAVEDATGPPHEVAVEDAVGPPPEVTVEDWYSTEDPSNLV